MFDFLSSVPSVRMTDAECDEDFDERWERASNFDRWKLERRQHFVEPWNDKWVAFDRGDWAEVLRLDAARAEQAVEGERRLAERGIRQLRLRVVEMPLTPYLQWELHMFRNHVVAGEQIRIIGPEPLAPFEAHGLVQELVNVGADALYETVYDADGLATEGIRFDGTEAVAAYSAFMQQLFEQGEDFVEFFDREVAHLPPPVGATA